MRYVRPSKLLVTRFSDRSCALFLFTLISAIEDYLRVVAPFLLHFALNFCLLVQKDKLKLVFLHQNLDSNFSFQVT